MEKKTVLLLLSYDFSEDNSSVDAGKFGTK
jgi:hypothetical protein